MINYAEVLSHLIDEEGFIQPELIKDPRPAGFIDYYAGNVPPPGWLACNGNAYSRTVYAELFATLGTRYGNGDGSTTFNVPDLRGVFIRGWDAGRGIDPNRVLGSSQGDAIRNITGDSSGNAAFTAVIVERNAVKGQGNGAMRIADTGEYGNGIFAGGTYNGKWALLDFNASRVVPTANENRPRNVALLACIKY